MSPSRQLALLGFLCAGAALVVKVVQVTATLETRIAIQRGLTAAASNVVVQAFFVVVIFAALISMIVLAWDRMDRDYKRRTARRDLNVRLACEADQALDALEDTARRIRDLETKRTTQNDRGANAA